MIKKEITANLNNHERIYLELDTFLDQNLLDKEAILVAKHLIQCEICLKRLVELLEVENIFFLVFSPEELFPQCKLDYNHHAAFIPA